ncbi:29774_t:CDS:1, partial [Racocetra persica]
TDATLLTEIEKAFNDSTTAAKVVNSAKTEDGGAHLFIYKSGLIQKVT